MLPPPPLKILIITGESSRHRAEELANNGLSEYEVALLSGIPADPTVVSVQEVVRRVETSSPDWIIAIGGGSVLDTAKAAAVLAKNDGDTAGYLGGEHQFKFPGIPLVAIPTTSGSGSEVTPYASITDSGKMAKNSLSHDYLYPKYAVLDPSLTLSLSPWQTAVSGMDALSHSIEGYWSNRATAVTDDHAISAAKILLAGLPEAYAKPDDLESRRAAMDGSMLAGLTISNARTTAVHAISYPMTVYYHVPHGLACALLLPSVIRYNSGAMNAAKERRLLDALKLDSMNNLADAVENVQGRLGLPRRLGEVGIGQGNVSTIVANGFRPDRMSNNPREISAADLTKILEQLV